jgi:hypothetical protein
MKTVLSIGLLITIFLLANCNKSSTTANHINCDGLITDTAGTNDNGRIYMPNAFTPNSDGLNDISRPFFKNVTSFTFTIYDDNNNIVFTSGTPGAGWATTAGANTWSTYYYKIQVTTTTGHNIGQCGPLYKLTCFPSSIPKSSLYFEDQLGPSGFFGTTSEGMGTCP